MGDSIIYTRCFILVLNCIVLSCKILLFYLVIFLIRTNSVFSIVFFFLRIMSTSQIFLNFIKNQMQLASYHLIEDNKKVVLRYTFFYWNFIIISLKKKPLWLLLKLTLKLSENINF